MDYIIQTKKPKVTRGGEVDSIINSNGEEDKWTN